MTFWPERLLHFHLNFPSLSLPFGAGCKHHDHVREQLSEDTDVAAQVKSSLHYGGVPRVLGMCLAPLDVVGIAGLHRAYTKSA